MPDDRELRVLANEPQSRHSLEQKMSEVVHQQATINDLISELASRRLRVSKGAPWMSKLLECTAIACMHTEAVAAAPSSVAPTGCKAHSAEFEHLECHVVRHDCGKPLAPTRRDRSRSLPIFDVGKWASKVVHHVPKFRNLRCAVRVGRPGAPCVPTIAPPAATWN